MIFVTRQPGPALSEFVAWYWYYEGYEPIHRLERIMPDGTFELCINLRGEARHVYDRDTHQPVATYRGAWLSGTHTRHIVIDAAQDSSMMGAHFKPGGAAAVLGLPARELTDRVVEVDAVWGQAGRELRESLIEAHSPSAKFAKLETFLARLASRTQPRSMAVRHALRRLCAEPAMVSIGAVVEELGWSHKHMIQQFQDEVGLTPKRFCRIQRFQGVLRAIEKKRAVEWADLACACGYYDQAHFISEFRDFSGLKPSTYLSQQGEYLGFVPVPEPGSNHGLRGAGKS